MSQAAPRVAGIVLAAGRSGRMGGRNKLLIADADGTPMVARTVDALRAGGADPVVVVLGHDAAAIRAALDGRAVAFVENPDHATGMASSLRVGLRALARETSAALIALADMPMLTGALIARIIAAYDPASGAAIVVPLHQGQRGNPVLWDRRFFAAMSALQGDVGARGLLATEAAGVRAIELSSAAILQDFDTPGTLAAFQLSHG